MTSTAAAPPAATKKKGAETRPYKVLKEISGVGATDSTRVVYELVGVYTASGDAAAIKLAAKEHGNDTYVAVAESGWHRRSPKIETKEVVSWV